MNQHFKKEREKMSQLHIEKNGAHMRQAMTTFATVFSQE